MSHLSLPSDSAGEILEIGFLVQWAGINPATGEAWKPVWVSRDECPAELVARWEARNRLRNVGAAQQTNKRSASPSTVIDSEASVKRDDEQLQKKPKLDGKPLAGRKNNTSGNAAYPGFRPFHKKPKPGTGARRTTMPNEPIQASAKDTGLPAELTGKPSHWLLDPVIATKSGMMVVLTGTHRGPENEGWYNGDYESERGVILSVFNTGNSAFSSTAQVKILEARKGAPSAFVIPVEFLAPVRPERPGQKALVLDGACQGEVAVLREDGAYEGEWFVSARNNHFEISGEKLVLYHDSDV